MRRGSLIWSAVVLTILIATVTETAAQESFFKGKTIRVIVGYAPGGGFDAYSRLIARHASRHIPGNPAIIVENMPGAGGLITANHLYKVAKADGNKCARCWNYRTSVGTHVRHPSICAPCVDALAHAP